MARKLRGPGVQMSGETQVVQGTLPAGEKAIIVTLQEAASYEKCGITFIKGVPQRVSASMRDLFDHSPWFTVREDA